MTEAEKEPWVRIAGQERAEYFERRKRINRPAKGQKTPMTVGDISCVALPSSSMISDVGMNLTDDSPSSECRIGSGEPEDERTDIHIKLNDARIEKDDCSEPIDYAVELSPHNLLVVPREIDLFPELHSSLGIGNWSLVSIASCESLIAENFRRLRAVALTKKRCSSAIHLCRRVSSLQI